MADKWKEIEKTNGRYYINSNGDVCSVRYVHNKGKDSHYVFYPLKPHINPDGYQTVNLCIDGKHREWRVHRLVMETFVGKSDLEVNHINGIKTDNRVENLEYTTRSQNVLHSFRILKRVPVQSMLGNTGFKNHLSHSIKLTNIENGEILIFGSLREAERVGEKRKWIARCLKNNSLYKDKYKVEKL